ncbi:uncharacterized protein MONOS_17965 [Monocercomonoides exilis]|uniref:uncharacterized protein n=1 Tax=Monocercomonoides exilis TaxID=2049356 RepID=UPI00355A50EF|nr:hypothetical protein MONOS_17965 [Monocercomonoides exilis]
MERCIEGRERSGWVVEVGEDGTIDGVVMEESEEEEVVEMNGLSEWEGRDGRDEWDLGEEMLEKREGEGEGEREGEGEVEEGEKRKGWMRETKEEKEECEMEKETGIGE